MGTEIQISKEDLEKIKQNLQGIIDSIDFLFKEIIDSKEKEIKKDIPKLKNHPMNLVTEKQVKFLQANDKQLRKLGFDLNNIQTKQDAFKVISEFKKIKEEYEP